MADEQTINQQIIKSLGEIHDQNEQIAKKIDKLETQITKKAAVYGAVAGGLTSGVLSVGIELIKAKFGG